MDDLADELEVHRAEPRNETRSNSLEEPGETL
jgi:hypothetical protein